MKKEIYSVCAPCGISANVLTCLKKYGKRPNKLAFDVSTMTEKICDVCGENGFCTEPRDYFYPDFGLLKTVGHALRFSTEIEQPEIGEDIEYS